MQLVGVLNVASMTIYIISHCRILLSIVGSTGHHPLDDLLKFGGHFRELRLGSAFVPAPQLASTDRTGSRTNKIQRYRDHDS